MAVDGYEAAHDSFIEDLNRAFRAAGPPTYSELQQVSEYLRARGGAARVDVLTRSNTHEILHGRRRQLPKWLWVWSFVTVLRSLATTSGVPAERIGTIDEWKRKYDAVRAAADRAARRPASAGRHRKQGGQRSPAFHQADAQTDARDSEVMRLLRQGGSPQWWHRYRDIAPESLDFYLYLESAAKVVRTYEPEVIPGLLQVEAYAREILTQYCPGAGETEVTRLVELRMRRQERLHKPSFQLWAIIEEAALLNRRLDKHIMRSQIMHLIDISEQANVTLQVLPPQLPRLDDHVTIKEPITHFRFPEEHLDDVVFLERPSDGVILTDRKEIAHYSQLMSLLGMRAAGAGDVQSLLRKILMEL
jgi:Domain of unknown function (DUF5753)